MTSPEVFVDTNVFAYLLDPDEPAKQQRAEQVLVEHADSVVVSTQVLVEVHRVCTSKFGMSREDSASVVQDLAGYPTVGADRELVLRAAEVATNEQLSIFDAMIIAAAQRAGVAEILSEDLNPGQDYGGVVVVNPFA